MSQGHPRFSLQKTVYMFKGKKTQNKVDNLLGVLALRVSQKLSSVFQDHNFVLWHLIFARIPPWARLSFLTIPKSFSKCLTYWLDFSESQLSSSSNFIWLKFLFQEEKNKFYIGYYKIYFSQLFKKYNWEKLLHFLPIPWKLLSMKCRMWGDWSCIFSFVSITILHNI